MADDPDALARLVNETRRNFANAYERPSNVAPWEERHPRQQALDRDIAAVVGTEVCKRIARECERRGNVLPPSDERNAWLSAAAVAMAVAREAQERSDEEGAENG